MSQPDAAAIFLHSGWRSCGTWLWEVLRESETVRAFYEPLHEDLARLDRAGLSQLSPASWKSGHSPGAPYFTEYLTRLRPCGEGITGYEKRFAFDDFFAGAERDDPALVGYVSGLIEAARAEGRLPVLKFCRSLGRVPWFVRHFPQAAHVVILRDPVSQWISARRQMEQVKNRYFVLAPFIILARNAAHPLVADAIARLGVPMPPHLSRDLGITTQVCWHHVKRLGWAERYRGFLALWAATSVAALQADATLIDADRLGADECHRAATQAMLRQASGLELDLFAGYCKSEEPTWAGSDAENLDAAQAAFAALDFVAGARGCLAAARTRLLVQKLVPRFGIASPARVVIPKAPPQVSNLLRRLDAFIYVLLARLTYPLRRLHYHARQNGKKFFGSFFQKRTRTSF